MSLYDDDDDDDDGLEEVIDELNAIQEKYNGIVDLCNYINEYQSDYYDNIARTKQGIHQEMFQEFEQSYSDSDNSLMNSLYDDLLNDLDSLESEYQDVASSHSGTWGWTIDTGHLDRRASYQEPSGGNENIRFEDEADAICDQMDFLVDIVNKLDSKMDYSDYSVTIGNIKDSLCRSYDYLDRQLTPLWNKMNVVNIHYNRNPKKMY